MTAVIATSENHQERTSEISMFNENNLGNDFCMFYRPCTCVFSF